MMARQTSPTDQAVASRLSYVMSGLKFTIGRYFILIPDMAQLLQARRQHGQTIRTTTWAELYSQQTQAED